MPPRCQTLFVEEYLVFESCGNPQDVARGPGGAIGAGSGNGVGGNGGKGDEDDVNELTSW